MPPVVDDAWFAAAYAKEPTDADRAALAASDEIVDEFLAADAIVITVPIYNFSVPAQLKLWIDQVCRSGRTFAYTKDGPKGLGADRPTYLVVVSGGTRIGSDIDFATGYMRHVLSFIGLKDVHIVEGDRLMANDGEKLPAVHAQIDAMVAAFEPRRADAA